MPTLDMSKVERQFGGRPPAVEEAPATANPFANGFGIKRTPGIAVLNLTEFADQEVAPRVYDPFPPGVYAGEVASADIGISKSSGALQATFAFKIYNQGETRFVRQYRRLANPDGSPPSQEDMIRLAKLLRSIDPEYDLSNVDPDRFASQLISKQVTLRVKIGKPYNGRVSNELDGDDGIWANPSADPFNN